MIKIDNVEHFDAVMKAQVNIGAYSNYIHDVLEPAIFEGDWDRLEMLDIGFDTNGNSLGKIGDNNAWKRLHPFFEPLSNKKNSIDFTFDGEVIERNLRNQMKSLALKMLWISPLDYSFGTIYWTVLSLKKFVKLLLSEGANCFSHIDYNLIERWVSEYDLGKMIAKQNSLSSINKLFKEKSGLPFEVSIKGPLSKTDFNIIDTDVEQYTVVPQRLFFRALCESELLVNNLYANRDEVKKLIEYLVNYKRNIYEGYAKHASQGMRVRKNGEIMWNLSNSTIMKERADAYKKEFLLLNSPSEEEILKLLHKHKPAIKDSFNDKCYPERHITVLGEAVSNPSEAERLLQTFSGGCLWAMIARSGIRVDEMYDLHTINGCKKEIISGHDVYIINADLNKTVKGIQSKQDEFVTTELSSKAYEILQIIHKPLRDMHDTNRYFHKFKGNFSAITKSNVGLQVKRWFKRTLQDELVMTEDDIRDLKISDPEMTFKAGDEYNFTPHQLRRTFAYYLIGYELLSFPQLKQQFSHLSLAMTRHYAKNASKFQKIRTTNNKEKNLYTDINDERVRQKAQIYLNIFKKLANNERVAGGKGKAFAKAMVKKGKLAFKDKTDNDMLTLAYWEKSIRDGRHHIHAVAPSIYCTSRNCDLRTQVNFIECVDCDNDYIVDAVYAEAARKEAEIAMNYDIENNELTPQTASESYIKITAAQRIMDELGIDYEPVEFPPQVNELLIPHIGA
ncbi:site-specific integrase [Vibrio parahaemolyticus]